MHKVVLLGRPNVGKSTLFNRLIRSNRAITHDRAGITRDRMEGTVRSKFHRPFILVDTGGITLDNHAAVAEGPAGLRGFEKEILHQAEDAIKEAAIICLVVDGRDGLMPFDEHLASYIRRLSKPVLLVVNKVDGMEKEDTMLAEFHILGFPLMAVSAEHGHQVRLLEEEISFMLPEPDDDEFFEGEEAEEFDPDFEVPAKKQEAAAKKQEAAAAKKQEAAAEKSEAESDDSGSMDEDEDFGDFGDDGGEILDFDALEEMVASRLAAGDDDLAEESPEDVKPEKKAVEKKREAIKVCLLGRPNAGKSSILNAFIGKNRMIVSEVAGTTRDSVDVPFEFDGHPFIMVDTAGVRRRTRISDQVERFSVNSSLKSTTKADVTLMVIDATAGITAQDKRLIELLDERKTPFIIVLNKMDLVPPSARVRLHKEFDETLAFCGHVPVMPTSAKNRYGLKALLPMAEQIIKECSVRIGTGQLNRAMEEALTRHQPPIVKRVRPKFYYLTQAESQPPTFVFFVNDADRITETYQRYLEKSLRRMFAIEHAPMRLHLRSSHKKADQKAAVKSPSLIDQKPRDDKKPREEKKEAKQENRSAGRATASPKSRTTLKAALRNPNSPQSRSLKKKLKKKEK